MEAVLLRQELDVLDFHKVQDWNSQVRSRGLGPQTGYPPWSEEARSTDRLAASNSCTSVYTQKAASFGFPIPLLR